MFPESKDSHSSSPKLDDRLSVTFTVPVYLDTPEGSARFRVMTALSAPVPETALYENADPRTRQDDVGTAWEACAVNAEPEPGAV